MEYKGANFHEECFCCSSCGDPIGKKSFVDRDDGYFCEECYETNFATICAKCRKVDHFHLLHRAELIRVFQLKHRAFNSATKGAP